MPALTGREYPPEVVFNAQELYCVVRLSYSELASEVGVGINTLKRWGQKYGWAEKRSRIAQAEADLRADTILARSAMLKKLIKSKDAQTGFAVASLETLAMRQADAARAQQILTTSKQRELREIHTPDDAVAALKDAVELKLNRMLEDLDSFDFRAIADVQKALGLIAKMETATRQSPDDGRSVSGENIDRMLDALR